MIKINLATRKQPAAVDSKPAGAAIKLDFGSTSELLKEKSIQRLLLVLMVAAAASWFADHQKSELLEIQQGNLSKLEQERGKLEEQAAKIKVYEKDKAEIEAAQGVIRTKLEVMSKLASDRGNASKILRTLSTALPTDSWLTEFRVNEVDILLKGNAVDFAQITDLVKAMQESATFTDVNLKTSQKIKDESGTEVASFELGAKQRQ